MPFANAVMKFHIQPGECLCFVCGDHKKATDKLYWMDTSPFSGKAVCETCANIINQSVETYDATGWLDFSPVWDFIDRVSTN